MQFLHGKNLLRNMSLKLLERLTSKAGIISNHKIIHTSSAIETRSCWHFLSVASDLPWTAIPQNDKHLSSTVVLMWPMKQWKIFATCSHLLILMCIQKIQYLIWGKKSTYILNLTWKIRPLGFNPVFWNW